MEDQIDRIIDNALKCLKTDLNNIDTKDFTGGSMFQKINEIYNEHLRASIKYINEKFPESHSSNLSSENQINNNIRFSLYAYSTKRNKEFESIKNDFLRNIY